MKKRKISPLKVPLIPNPEKYSDKSLFERDFSAWENRCNFVREENKKRFELALKRIKLCSYLRGFLGLSNRDKHFSWCPQDEWMNNKAEFRVEF